VCRLLCGRLCVRQRSHLAVRPEDRLPGGPGMLRFVSYMRLNRQTSPAQRSLCRANLEGFGAATVFSRNSL
jgi:hypothetical protein